MERMEGVDAGYLYMETPSMHMHTLKVALLEPARPFDFDDFTHQLVSRLDRLPPMQRRVLPVPFALNHPLWVVDEAIDPPRHVFHHRLPTPAGMAQLEALVGEVAGKPLDRSVPLWEVHVAEGMPDGRVAVIGKLHHALADGAAANALLSNLTDQPDAVTPGGGEDARRAPPVREPTPSSAEQVRLALRDVLKQASRLPALLWRTGTGVAAVLRHRRKSQVDVPRPILDVPRTSFNGPLTPRRLFTTCTVPLEDLKEVRRAHDGVSLNDVVLAVIAGALRAWLDARGEHPSGPLVAGVPVSTDPPGAPPRLAGNRVSNLFTSLATDVDDPHERLRTISRTTSESKVVQRTLGPNMLVDWVEFTPPRPFSAALRLYSRLRGAARHPPPFNVVVSNVRGPAEPVSISGTRLSDFFSVGPILEGIGLNVTAWSYVDRLNFSLLTCPDLIPDLRPLVAEIRPALDELRKAEG
jgi:diacylglycerol O-acyltransferase